ncbi:hypothetical protein BJAS_P1469 [Bathymodiolus japonicus methanotrophic gill symbiont]|uniref:hypothetical protein n=1 Tax=Bathymodiolus japonicus methanotrophic gill symbiont TaxID=113269 RepID=UPI001B610EF9|nr:hypothetical protein [Bathymodiolus japonicus methanotrophic gill symbiont]GFO71772.1 hypothetical protein BJAS_P1469 [Bathymodiolus japonicus methanotrophic gill symbiont]
MDAPCHVKPQMNKISIPQGKLAAALILFLLSIKPLTAWELSGYVGIEDMVFFEQPTDPQQYNNYLSGVIEAELYHEWDNGNQIFAFVPFFRGAQFDSNRTHFDIRELTYVYAAEAWEFRFGIRKVFWGVTESVHLVDIINQRDMVENTDGEDKLGQPMINFAWIQDWGTLDLFLLPGFREMPFTGVNGRPRIQPAVDSSQARFDKNGFARQMAYAIRWSHSIGDWDIGVSNFYGTSRDPIFLLEDDATGKIKIIPYYQNINQTGLDLQATIESWLLKLEMIVRVSEIDTTFATVAGFEYTFFNVGETGLDIGLLAEYLYDSRGNRAPTIFQDDFFTGIRFALNDVQDTQILAGVIVDSNTFAQFYNIEFSRCFFDNFVLEVEGRFSNGAAPGDRAYFFRNDSHFRFELSYHF